MELKNLFITGLLTLFIFGCTKKGVKELSFTKFPEEYNLKAIEIKNQGINFTPSVITIIDSLMILKNPKATEKSLYIYNKNNFKYITSFCQIGHGDGELIRPARWAINYKKRSIWILDYGNTKCWEFPIDSVLKNRNYLPKKYIQLPESLMPIGDMKWIKDTILAVEGTTGDALLYLYNEEGKLLERLGEKIIKREKNWKDLTYALVTDFRFLYNEEKDKIVVAYKHYDLVSFYKNGKHELSLRGPLFIKPEFEFMGDLITYRNRKTYIAYLEGDVYEDYIFFDFVGDKIGGYRSSKYVLSDFPRQIFVFDWEGNVIARINTDRVFGYYCIDREDKMIYAIDLASEEPIVKYDLRKVKALKLN